MDNVLIAKEGCVYTNGETFSNIIRLGINDSAENWHEISNAEYESMFLNETV
jgi:hypothetical protein